MLAVTNLILHDIDVPKIRHDNSLTRNVRDYKPVDKVDIIVTNPPFGGIEEDGILVNFPQQFQTKETADLFMVLLMYLLKDTGRAAIVLPDGFLFGEGVKTTIKEKLLEDIARACLYLTAKENNFVTGINLVVDGGMTKKMIYEE
jgi:type I restriction enzyme M protein